MKTTIGDCTGTTTLNPKPGSIPPFPTKHQTVKGFSRLLERSGGPESPTLLGGPGDLVTKAQRFLTALVKRGLKGVL